MRTLLATLLAFMVTLVFVSCQREVEPTNPPPPGANDSIYLSKYVELDTTLPSGSDTVHVNLYTYDAQKRVIKCVSTLYSSPADVTISEYTYTGNDTLPSKAVYTFTDVSSTYKDTSYLWYTNGVVSKDSTIEYNITLNDYYGTDVTYYTASGNNTLVREKYYYSSPTIPDDDYSGTLTQTRQNGNITVQDDDPIENVAPNRSHQEASYDNNINPFYRTEVPYRVLNKWVMQKNNTLEEKSWDIPGVLESHTRFTYRYRADGYPVTVVVHYNYSMSSPHGYKGLFFYTK